MAVVAMKAIEFRIEKGIDLPKFSGDQSRRYPFPDMEVGDSFAIPPEQAIRIRTAANNWGKLNGRKFSTRKHGGGYRVWRIA